MTYIAGRISLIEESQTIGMAKKSRELQAKGINVIGLHFGEPDFDTPDFIKAAAKKAIDEGVTKYTPVAGSPELRKAISEKFLKDNNLKYSYEQIVVSTGAKHALMNVIMSTINPGDEVLVPTPYWVSYSEMIKFAEGIPVYIKSHIDNNFKPDWEAIEKAVTPKTRMFIFSSPNNPTGNVWDHSDMKRLAEIMARHEQILIVADEIYEHIRFNGGHHISIGTFSGMENRVVTVNGVSKAFAMTGWRIGYIGAPLEIAQACEKLQSQFTSGANSIAQAAALAALKGELGPTVAMRKSFEQRRNFMVKRMATIPGVICNQPKGAFYVFPDVSSFYGKSYKDIKIKDAYDLCQYLLEEGHISVVTGNAFGNPECIRISYATTLDNLKIALDRMQSVLEKLK
jgi:aspartate aminotransferase